MTKTLTATPVTTLQPIAHLYSRFLDLGNHLPLSLVQLASRLAIASVFWNSAQSKLASWAVTQQLFAFEYQLPLLPPEIAAPLATGVELIGSLLLALGLFSRLAALALLGVVAVIQTFVFPGHWGEHLLWASLLLLIFARGAGKASLDHLAASYFTRKD